MVVLYHYPREKDSGFPLNVKFRDSLYYAPPAWHAHELARRQRLFAEGKIPVYDWSEVKSRLEARRAAL